MDLQVMTPGKPYWEVYQELPDLEERSELVGSHLIFFFLLRGLKETLERKSLHRFEELGPQMNTPAWKQLGNPSNKF